VEFIWMWKIVMLLTCKTFLMLKIKLILRLPLLCSLLHVVQGHRLPHHTGCGLEIEKYDNSDIL